MHSRFLQSITKRKQANRYLIPAYIAVGCLCLYFIVFYCLMDANNAHATDSHVSLSQSRQKIRLICISDTHNGYDALTQQLIELYESENDIFIHAGDMTDRGSIDELNKINDWFGKLPYKHIITISGNMDGIGLDKGNVDGYKVFTNAIYLEHEYFEIKDIGLKLFATPYTPKFVGGFQLMTDVEAAIKWKDIPSNIDVLISHGPPKSILDSTSRGDSIGDKVLSKELERIQPKAMIYGHVHASYGYQENNGIQYANAAMFNGIYHSDDAVKPIVVTVDV
eukprot:542017_1